MRGEDEDLLLEEGEHVTFVDVITDTKAGDMNRSSTRRPAERESASTCASPWVTVGPR